MKPPSVHASAVRIGAEAVLIRGPSGSGKSRLAIGLIQAGRARQIPATYLIGDDRVDLSEQDGRLIVGGVPELAGLIEIRGLGIRRCEHIESAPVAWVVDLHSDDAARLPDRSAMRIRIGGVTLLRLPVARDFDALPLVIAALTTDPADGPQGLGNHIGFTLAAR